MKDEATEATQSNDIKNDPTWLAAAINADDWKKRERQYVKQATYQRLKVPFQYTTFTFTPRRGEDPELFIALQRFTPYAVCSMSKFLRMTYVVLRYDAIRTVSRAPGHLARGAPPSVKNVFTSVREFATSESSLSLPVSFQLVTLHRSQCAVFSQCFLRL